MKLAQPRLPDMLKGEGARLQFPLKAALDGATITSVEFCSSPSGLTFGAADYSGDDDTTIETDMTASQAGEYTVKCSFGRSNGLTGIVLAYVTVNDVCGC